jgi:hypothetical protein
MEGEIIFIQGAELQPNAKGSQKNRDSEYNFFLKMRKNFVIFLTGMNQNFKMPG